jgi:serine/threonine protein kinase
MADETQVDQLLDTWEEQCARDPQLELADFVDRHCAGFSQAVIEEFQSKAKRLASIDQQVAAIGVCASTEFPNSDSVETENSCKLSDLQPGFEPVTGYSLVEQLGKGGFGEVWKTIAPGGFQVALKFVQLEGRIGEIELRALDVIKEVRHPHLLSTHGTWQRGDLLIIAMELADGTLHDRFQEATKQDHTGIPRDELLGYFVEAAKGIDYLNRPKSDGGHGIQHRDIKPRNILLSGGSVKVGDFGLARSLQHSETDHTGSHTPNYAAPEFLNGKTSSRSDQYSLAITWCHLRSGKLPFTGTLAQVIAGHLKREPDLSMLPEAERNAVARALAKNPKDRWPSCSDFVRALHATALPATIPTTIPLGAEIAYAAETRSSHRRLKPIVFGLLAILLVVGIGVVSQMMKPGPSGNQHAQSSATNSARESTLVTKKADGPVTLAVLDFENHSQDPALDGFRLGFRDMLVTDLSRVSSIKVLERARLAALLEEHDLAKTPFIDAKTAIKLGRGLSAQAMLNGSFVIAGEDIRIDVRLVSVETGEVLLAEAVNGKKSDLFGLQQTLARQVISALDVTLSDAEQRELESPQSWQFAAFQLYSEARLAQLRGQRAEAERRFREVLEQDPDFPLAAQELDRLEVQALLRLTEDRRQKAATTGKVGEQLQQHYQRHQEIIEADRRDAEYYGSLIVLSAHAGLWGENKTERRLLHTFWKRFALSVPSDEALHVAHAMNQILKADGKFFQQLVDSGDYSIALEGFPGQDTQKYLKPELRGVYRWPHYSALWPFDDSLRFDFDLIKTQPEFADQLKQKFESALPTFPHDYLHILLEDLSVNDPSEEAQLDKLRLPLSVIRYYSTMPDKPAALQEDVSRLERRLLSQLDGLAPDEVELTFLTDAMPVLDRLAETVADVEIRERANKLLLRFAQQARINQNLDPPHTDSASGSISFCTLQLTGPSIVFLIDLGDLGGDPFSSFVHKQLADAVRGLRPKHRFDIRVFGEEASNGSALFGELRPAIPKNQQQALAFIKNISKLWSPDQSTKLQTLLDAVTADWKGDKNAKGDICIIHFEDAPSLPKDSAETIRKRLGANTLIHLVSALKSSKVAALVRTAGGRAVLLEEGDFFDVKIVAWPLNDESSLEPRGK